MEKGEGRLMLVEPLFRITDYERPPAASPGVGLARRLTGDLEDLSDADLLDAAAAARRQTSWAQARELAAIAELTRRRTIHEAEADAAREPDYRILTAHESVVEEVAVTLTVTGNTAATLVHLAERLHTDLPGTRHALETGRIDLPRARVIVDMTDTLPTAVTAQIETTILDDAPTRTTGQLRRTLKRLTRRLAPDEADERARTTTRNRRLEVWETAAGTAAVTLMDVAPEDAHAAHNKITAAARGIKAHGDPRTLHQLRADLATHLLQGATLPDAIRTTLTITPAPLLNPDTAPAPDPVSALVSDRAWALAPDRVPSLGSGPVSGLASACATDLVLDRAPDGVPGLGSDPVPDRAPDRASERASGLSPDRLPGTTSDRAPGLASDLDLVRGAAPGLEAGRDATLPIGPARHLGAVPAHGEDHAGRDATQAVVLEQVADAVQRCLAYVEQHARETGTLYRLPAAIGATVHHLHRELAGPRTAVCRDGEDRHGRPGYRPPTKLRREIEERHPTCVFPTCNQSAARCDLDHTVPWPTGTTCRCNLAPLCRRHHRTKQSNGWTLTQIWPELLVWVTPSGTWHITRPDRQ